MFDSRTTMSARHVILASATAATLALTTACSAAHAPPGSTASSGAADAGTPSRYATQPAAKHPTAAKLRSAGTTPTSQHATAAERHTAGVAQSAWLTKNHFVSHVAQVNGVRLHYVIGGAATAPMVVLLHGWPETWWEYHKVAPLLAAHYRVLIPGLVGIGGSQPTAQTDYTAAAMARDVHGVVQKLGGINPLVVGHDVGAFVAYAYAGQFRTQVRALMLIAVAVPNPEYLKLTALPVMPAAFRWWFALHNEPRVAERLIGTNLRWYLNNFYDHHDPGVNVRTGAINRTDRDVYLSAYSNPGALHDSFLWYRTILQDVKDNKALMARKLSVPVMGIVDAVDAAGVTPQMPKLSDRAQSVVVAGTGHWLPEQVPGLIAKRITALAARS